MTCDWEGCTADAAWMLSTPARVHSIRPQERGSCASHLSGVAALAALELRTTEFKLVGVDAAGPIAA